MTTLACTNPSNTSLAGANAVRSELAALATPTPENMQRFINPVQVHEQTVSLTGWDGNLSALDTFTVEKAAKVEGYRSFHSHVERANEGQARVVNYTMREQALPKEGPAKLSLQPPNAILGQPIANSEKAVLAVFPSGIGMAYGGAAADARNLVEALRSISHVVTNPNTVHASAFNALDYPSTSTNRVMILPGTGHKEFLQGDFSLRPWAVGERPKITLVTDNPASDIDMMNHLQVPQVLRGLHLSGGLVSTDGLGVDIGVAPTGRAESHFATMYPLVQALGVLEKQKQLDGVVLTSYNFNSFEEQQYLMHLYGLHRADGQPEANAMVNAEVSISALVKYWSGELSMHGPGTNYNFVERANYLRTQILAKPENFLAQGWNEALIKKICDQAPAQPNSSGEVTSSKGMGCLMTSAVNTPIMLDPTAPAALTAKNVVAVTVPNGCELSDTTIAAAKAGIPVVVDLSNQTIQTSSAWLRALPEIGKYVVYCNSSVEMLGVVQKLKGGASLQDVQALSVAERLAAGQRVVAQSGLDPVFFGAEGQLQFPEIKVQNLKTTKAA